MRTRTLSLLTVLALAVAACGGGSADETTTTTEETAATTTTTIEEVVDAPEAARLAYALEPGASFEYEVDIDQTIELTTEGDTAALGEGEDIPGDMSLSITGTTTFSQSVSEGPEPGTFEVTITGDFSDLTFTGTVDGESIEDGEIPELAQMEPVNVTVVVDKQGNIVSDDEEVGDLFGDIGGLGGLGDMAAPGMDPGSFIGPPLPDEEVTVGDTWTETIETPGFLDDEAIITEVKGEVTGTDTIDGFEVLVIETEMTTSAFEFDMAEFLIGFFTAFIPEDASEEDLAELDLIKEQLRFAFGFDESVGVTTTWFDAEAGLARRSEIAGAAHIVMDINMPDEESGGMVGLLVDMSIDQKLAYRLVDSTGA